MRWFNWVKSWFTGCCSSCGGEMIWVVYDARDDDDAYKQFYMGCCGVCGRPEKKR